VVGDGRRPGERVGAVDRGGVGRRAMVSIRGEA